LLATYRDDFGKYASRIPRLRLERLLNAVPRLLGRKFKFSQVDREQRAAALRSGLEHLSKARLCHVVRASDCAGVPLGATVRERVFKVIMLDTGLVSASLGLSPRALGPGSNLALTNVGAITEQAVGQALRSIEPRFKEPELYYWTREKRGSHAEIDYAIEHAARVIPIEVKAGATGSLKSLHLFMALRRLPVAVRFNADMPSQVDVDVKTTDGAPARYRLLSLPAYFAGKVDVWLDRALADVV
jgi:predicted AAA+ superfamily ATPase